jgi:hypothetical protein
MDIAAAGLDSRPRSHRRPMWKTAIILRLLHDPLIGSIAPRPSRANILAGVGRLATDSSAARPQHYDCRCKFHDAVCSTVQY